MLVVQSAVDSNQTALTEEITKKTVQFLNYVTLYPDNILTFRASRMLLNVYCDTLYLIKQK